MAVQLSTSVRNARLDAIQTAIGTSPILRVYSGSAPANTAASATGTLLAEATLPSTWLNSASSGSITKSGTWQDLAANNNGTAGYFRILESTGTTCHFQGTTTATGGGGDMELNTTTFATNDIFTVTSFTLPDANS